MASVVRTLTDEEVLDLFRRVGAELQWVTAGFLMSDTFHVVDAMAKQKLGDLVDRGLLKHDRGWLSV